MNPPGSTTSTSQSVQPLRCAVYTRTSREGETESTFSSINAQLEACYGYIASRHHMSWLPASVSYDDPGISGGTLERTGLTKMLADIEAGLIDMVVVHKIDRLGRSVAHFARLIEQFDHHHVTLGDFLQKQSLYAGRMRMSHLGKRGLRSRRASTACMACLDMLTPFS